MDFHIAAVSDVMHWKSLTREKAAGWLKSRALTYRSEKFPVGMQKWLEKQMYKQGAVSAPINTQPSVAEMNRKIAEQGRAR